MIDLHTHSNASDGTDSPAQLVATAAAAGLSAFAITDHDTTAGWVEAAAAVEALPTPMTLIRGTEFSCVHVMADKSRIALHLLGYLYDAEAPELKAERARLRQNRLGRGEQIVDNLAAAGYPVSWRQVSEIAAGAAVGRPHIGQALMQAGVVGSVNEAFSQLLASSSPYYVPKQDMAVLDAIRLIRSAGGVPVIAHAWARKRGRVLPEPVLADLVEHGMLGIEVDHPDHAPADREQLRALAGRWGILTTGSSDYHGTNKSTRIGAEMTGPDQLERIVAAASGTPLVSSVGK
jgi:predicted metal-dependent phosphoesterase TrpH